LFAPKRIAEINISEALYSFINKLVIFPIQIEANKKHSMLI
jgi:hypothetical protein